MSFGLQIINWITLLNPQILHGTGLFLLIGTAIAGVTFVVSALILIIGFLVTSALAPFLGIAAAVVGGIIAVAAIIGVLVDKWKQVTAFLQPVIQAFDQFGKIIGSVVGPLIKQISADFASQTLPLIQQIGGMIKATLIPAWNQLVQAFNQAKPAIDALLFLLKWLGIIIGVVLGGVVAVALGLLVGSIEGFIHMMALLITGLASLIGGAITVVIGVVTLVIQIISTLFNFFSDLITKGPIAAIQNFGKNVSQMGGTVVSILKGLGLAFMGLGTIVMGLVMFVVGFVQGFIHWIQVLWETLFGHSIMIDIQNGFKSVFNAIFAIGNSVNALFVQPLITVFNVLWKGIQIGIALGLSYFNNFKSGFQTVYNWLKQVVSDIKNFFSGLFDSLGQGISKALGFFNNFKNGVLSALRGVLGPIETVLQGLANIPAVGGVFNGILGLLHSVHFAAGGIVSKPTYALIGEGNESEVIAPMSKLIAAAQLAMIQNSNQTSGQNRGGVIQFVINNKVVAEAALDGLNHTLKMNGAGRWNR